jgi:CheY-like chemotaxis protein
MHALLVTADSSLVATFTQISEELGIRTEPVGNVQNVSGRLNSAKYEAVLLDADTVPSAIPVISAVRESRSSTHAVVFVVASKATDSEQALERGAHFLLQRPIDAPEIRRTLRAAYDLMLGESRRYFRCKAELPVILGTSHATFQCSTVNVSGNGMAVRTAVPLELAEPVDIEVALPDGFSVRASGLVVWHDREGNSGLKFHCSGPEMRQKLDAWLDSQFVRSEPATQ